MPSFTSSPTSVTVSTTGNVLTLIGSGTSWSGSPFTLTGGSGASITSQSVSSTTAATVTITSGNSNCSLKLSDGTNSVQVIVTPSGQVSVASDLFIRANTSLGAPGNSWIDSGSNYQITSNQLSGKVAGTVFNNRVMRPLVESFKDGAVRIHYGPNWGGGACVLMARIQNVDTLTRASIGAYFFPGQSLASGNFDLFTTTDGSTARNSLITSASGATSPTEGWFEIVFSGSTITANIYQADGVTFVASITYATLSGTALLSGTTGINDYTGPQKFTEFESYAVPGISVSPATMTANSAQTFAVTGVGTNFSGIPFTVSGVTGCTITAQSVSGALTGSVTVTSASNAGGTLTLTDTISGYTTTVTVTGTSFTSVPTSMTVNGSTTFALTGSGTLWTGTPFTVSGVSGVSITSQSVSSNTAASVTILAGSTSGTAVLTDTISGAVLNIPVNPPSMTVSPATYTGTGTVSVTVTGVGTSFSGTPFTVTGTPSASLSSTTINSGLSANISIAVGLYAGPLTITDSVSGATTTLTVFHSKGALKIGFIGDSITFGYLGSVVTPMANNLGYLNYVVTTNNQAISGTTTTQWVNGFVNLTNVISAFTTAGVQYVQIMLGTNDAKTNIRTPVATYVSNMQTIVNACLAAGFKVVINQATWPAPTAVGWDATSQLLVQEYYQAVKSICNGTTVFAGDTGGFDYFQNNPSFLADGIHPSTQGGINLGEIWTNSFLTATGLNGGGSSAGGFVDFSSNTLNGGL